MSEMFKADGNLVFSAWNGQDSFVCVCKNDKYAPVIAKLMNEHLAVTVTDDQIATIYEKSTT